ncbi:hypothetical protein OE88DRAFT_1636713 [Heliocybe sulcata]|uniref:ferric-chelate reductase (NADPH) n=1 Tax=Heliocybe sulcata TaxID=5364 RepID=A0A5C3MPF2_9AGAM|nr:hypothetical protein OE88DRAFT_1636713 [Heliocybe sulcata]
MKDEEQLAEIQILYQLIYPYQTWYTWAGIVGLATIVNLVSRSTSLINRYSSSRVSQNGNDRSAIWRVTFALANAWRVIAYRSTVHFGWGYSMSFLEFFLTAGYLTALLAWSWVHIWDLEFGADYVANRLGTIAVAQFPLMTVLGTKNNIISFLTGVGHDKLNYLHRMTARVAFVILWMHAGLWVRRALIMLPEFWYDTVWVRAGVLGLVAFTILCFTSIRPAREKSYEWFLWGHFALVFIFLVGAYYHTVRCLYHPWILACLGIWAFDRLVRVLRVAYFSIASRLSRWRSSRSPTSTARFESRATVELLTPHHVSVRLQRPRGFHWGPGQTAYLMAPGVSVLPWEAHPFTIASVDGSRYNYQLTNGSDAGSIEKTHGDGDADEKDELVFIVGVMQGFTGRLGKRVAESERVTSVTALVEGPYGDGEDVLAYDTVLLVAGGTGVAWTLPLLIDTIRRAHLSYRKCRKLIFVWAVKDMDHASWISDSLRRIFPLLPSLTDMEVSIRIFITRERNFSTPNVLDDQPPSTPESVDEKSLEEGKSCADVDAVLSAPCVQVESGRPDVCASLGVSACGRLKGIYPLLVCGSASLAEAVRVGARVNPLWGRNSILRGGPNVVLKVESFGYA